MIKRQGPWGRRRSPPNSASSASSAKGLTADAAKQRLETYGPNAIQAHEASRWSKLVGYLWGPIPWMIEAAALISLLRQDWPDFAVVTGLLIYNAAVGFWQDNKAANALAALKQGLALKARVLRGNQWLSVDAAELVPGDVVTVSAGEIVPADILLIQGEYLSVDQAALTGESLPVSKRVGDSAYSGSIAKQGSMTAVVTATGNHTFFGRTAKLVAAAGSKSHSEQAVLQIGDFLILLAGALALVLIGFQVYRDIVVADVWGWATVGSIAQFVLVLLIASVPVAMPAVMSVTMALGALALSKQKAIVSRLSAIEELAGVDVLCSDKTGTLTMNRLKLDAPIPYGDAKPEDVVFAAALASQRSSEDAIDVAVFQGLSDPTALDKVTQTAFVPFDPVNKKTVATVTDAQGRTFHYAKGAPQAIAELCRLDPVTRGKYDGQVNDLAGHGYRALGVASSADGQAWTLLGLLSLLDPPRPDAQATIAETQKLGLAVKMVTGDDVAIGSEIAKQLGMGGHLLVASDVFKDGTDPDHIPLGRGPGGRARRRLRPRVPAAQVRDRQGPAAAGPPGRHDRRRGQRRAGAEAGRLRRGGERGHRCRPQRRGTDPDRTGPVDDRQRDRRIAQDLRADPELRLLPHRDDARHHVRRGPVLRVLRLPAPDRDHDRGPGAARRHPDHDHRLRQRPAVTQAGALADAPDPGVLLAHGPARHRPELRPGARRHGVDERPRADGALRARTSPTCRPCCSCSSPPAAICCCSSCAPAARSWSRPSPARHCSWPWWRPRSRPC